MPRVFITCAIYDTPHKINPYTTYKANHTLDITVIAYQIGVFITFSTAPFDISSNILVSSGHRRMRIPPLKPSHQDESNGGIAILLRPLDAEFIGKMSSTWHYHFRYCAI